MIGSVPPVDSITISAQKTPVEMCTEAIFDIAILSSLLPKNRPFTREIRWGLITSLVGKKKFPCVHREAANVSAGEESIGLRGGVVNDQSLDDFNELDPFQRALLPDPDIADDQDG